MDTQIGEYWSCPFGLYTLNSNIITYADIITKDSTKNRILIFSSATDWDVNKETINRWDFKGIAIIIGDLIELSKIISSFELSKIETIIACKIKTNGHQIHKLLLVLNFSEDKKPYREIREKYTYCPLCGKSSKDYGGKKHHYPSDGTWIRDVWNIFTLTEPLVKDKMFLEAIYNLFCLNENQKIEIIQGKTTHKIKSDIIEIPTTEPLPNRRQEKFPIFIKYNQRLIHGDSLKVLPWLTEQNELFDLIFVDPPYNLGKKYDKYNDKQNLQQYIDWCVTWGKMAYPLLTDEGYFVILNTPLNIMLQLPTFFHYYEVIGDIVWNDLAVPITGKIQASYYSIVFFGKKRNKINRNWYQLRDAIYCKRNTCLISEIPIRDGYSIWSDIYRTRQKSRRWNHPCNLPEELIERIIEMTQSSLNMKQLKILDFFVGVGTTTMASLRKDCFSTGIELSNEYFETSKRRLEHQLYRNEEKSIKTTSNGKTKRSLQKLVAKVLETSDRLGKNYSTSEQIQWLLNNKIVSQEDLSIFIRPGELLKGVGKGGAPGENNVILIE